MRRHAHVRLRMPRPVRAVYAARIASALALVVVTVGAAPPAWGSPVRGIPTAPGPAAAGQGLPGQAAAGQGLPGPVLAAPVKNPWPVAECVVSLGDGTFRAVFGYEKGGQTVDVPIGPNNTLTPSTLNGVQPTTFRAGRVEGAFATPPIDNGVRVVWKLYTRTANASQYSRACGPEVSLPGEGNGIGAVLVLVISVLVAMVMLRHRSWRERRRSA